MSLSHRVLRVAAAAVVSLSWSGCSKAMDTTRNPFAPGSSTREGQVSVTVENQNFGDATIHAVRGGERIRLGNVTGKSNKDFKVRWTFSLPLEFEVHIVGGQDCYVRPMTVDPGDKVYVRIPIELSAQACYSGKIR